METRPDTQNQPKADTAGLAPHVTAEQVKAFLRLNPDFIAADPDLIETILPPAYRNDRNVLDMQQFMINRLKARIVDLKDIQAELLDASEVNAIARDRIHTAILNLLDARSFEHFIEYLTCELAPELEIDAVSLSIESAGGAAGIALNRVRVIEPQAIDHMLGTGRSHLLARDVPHLIEAFGRTPLPIRSHALVRLDISRATPDALLAIGSTNPEAFSPEQASDLLLFLGRTVERCIRIWLDLPPPA